ncbi:hypothetical protein K438DRAFT_1960030 [Mycena galopus ATCC 62051]|nr:hypothetical protein K438DRAFT_1960030 [Mycena galopus ATCC 62051]
MSLFPAVGGARLDRGWLDLDRARSLRLSCAFGLLVRRRVTDVTGLCISYITVLLLGFFVLDSSLYWHSRVDTRSLSKCGVLERTHSCPRPEHFPLTHGPLARSTVGSCTSPQLQQQAQRSRTRPLPLLSPSFVPLSFPDEVLSPSVVPFVVPRVSRAGLACLFGGVESYPPRCSFRSSDTSRLLPAWTQGVVLETSISGHRTMSCPSPTFFSVDDEIFFGLAGTGSSEGAVAT